LTCTTDFENEPRSAIEANVSWKSSQDPKKQLEQTATLDEQPGLETVTFWIHDRVDLIVLGRAPKPGIIQIKELVLLVPPK
jgi:hypothetical protein